MSAPLVTCDLLYWSGAVAREERAGSCIPTFLFYLFIYLWLCWIFLSVRGLSLVAASGGHSSSRCAGLSLSRPLPLRGTGSRRAGSAVVAHGPSRSVAWGIFPDQGSNPCPLHWQADSQPPCHQGSPIPTFKCFHLCCQSTGEKCGGVNGESMGIKCLCCRSCHLEFVFFSP